MACQDVSSAPLVLKFNTDGDIEGLKQASSINVSSINTHEYLLSGVPFQEGVEVTVGSVEPTSPGEGDLWYDVDCDVGGGGSTAPVVSATSVSTNYNLSSSEQIIYVDATVGNLVISGVTASSYTGRILDIQKIDSTNNIVSVSGLGSTFSGDSILEILTQYESFTIHSFNNTWYIL